MRAHSHTAFNRNSWPWCQHLSMRRNALLLGHDCRSCIFIWECTFTLRLPVWQTVLALSQISFHLFSITDIKLEKISADLPCSYLLSSHHMSFHEFKYNICVYLFSIKKRKSIWGKYNLWQHLVVVRRQFLLEDFFFLQGTDNRFCRNKRWFTSNNQCY